MPRRLIYMKLKCNQCWKIVTITTRKNGPHIQATCSICGRYIKFLNGTERRNLLIELEKRNGLATVRQRP